MIFIWATRGRTWGFRFISTGGVTNPLEIYEPAFAGIEASPVAFRRSGETIAVRFPDPDGRMDRAGRVIPHDFVILASETSDIRDLEDAQALLWPAVSSQYEAIWDKPAGPAIDALQ